MAALPEPFWLDESRGLRLFHGDCRDLLPCFTDGEFGSVITDPPYGVGIADWDIPPDSAILRECLRVATGTVVMFGAAPPRSMVHFWSLAPERMLIWSPPPGSVGTPVSTNGMLWRYHPVFCWRLPKGQAVIGRDVLAHATLRSHGVHNHSCRKPPLLFRDLCRAFGGTSVLDPYCGSGTTLVACAKLGIPCTGVELEEKYCAMAVARLTEDLTYGPRNLFNQGLPDG